MLFRTGRQVAIARIEKGLTTYSLAAQLDVAQSSVAQWETGVRLPVVKLLDAAQSYLSINIKTFKEAYSYEKFLEGLTKNEFMREIINTLKASIYYWFFIQAKKEGKRTAVLSKPEYLLFLNRITINEYIEGKYTDESLSIELSISDARSLKFSQLCDFVLYLYSSIKFNFREGTFTLYGNEYDDKVLEMEWTSQRPKDYIYLLQNLL